MEEGIASEITGLSKRTKIMLVVLIVIIIISVVVIIYRKRKKKEIIEAEAEAKVADTNNPVGKIIIGGNKIGSTRSGATPINKIGGTRSGATPINKVGGTRSGATTQAQQNQNATSGRG